MYNAELYSFYFYFSTISNMFFILRRDYDAKEEVMEHTELLVLPILRNGMKAHVGWSEKWVEENK